MGVIRDLVSAGKDFGDEMRILLRLKANHEKSRAGFEPAEQIENSDGVDRRWTIINRQPDLGLRGRKRSNDWSEPLAVRDEGRIEKEDVGNDERSEREEEMGLGQTQGQEGCDKGEPQHAVARPA